jgi:hypothetical protein
MDWITILFAATGGALGGVIGALLRRWVAAYPYFGL